MFIMILEVTWFRCEMKCIDIDIESIVKVYVNLYSCLANAGSLVRVEPALMRRIVLIWRQLVDEKDQFHVGGSAMSTDNMAQLGLYSPIMTSKLCLTIGSIRNSRDRTGVLLRNVASM